MNPVNPDRDSDCPRQWSTARTVLSCRGASHGVPRHTKPPQLCPHEPDVAMAAGDLNSIGPTAFIYPMIRGRDRAFDIPVMLRDPSSHVTRLSDALPTHLSLVHAVGNQILPIARSVDRCNLAGQLLGNSGNPSGPLFHHGYALEQAVGSGRLFIHADENSPIYDFWKSPAQTFEQNKQPDSIRAH